MPSAQCQGCCYQLTGAERRRKKKTAAAFLKKMREGCCQSDEHWNYFKGLENFGEGGWSTYGFSGCRDTILNWNEVWCLVSEEEIHKPTLLLSRSENTTHKLILLLHHSLTFTKPADYSCIPWISFCDLFPSAWEVELSDGVTVWVVESVLVMD